MSSPSLRKKSNEVIYQAARCTEVVVSVIIFTVIIISLFSLLYDLTQLSFLDMSESFFNTFLSRSLGLVVGLEFIKMLCKHTAETVVEVLMFAIARQMVVEHLATFETLIGVLAIAILFFIRKYLLIHDPRDHQIPDKL